MTLFENRIFEARHVTSWVLFAAGAGLVNAGALLATKVVVSHVTGSITNAAVDRSAAAVLVVVVALFIAGAAFGTACVDKLRHRPVLSFALPLSFTAALIALSAALGDAGWFGSFGSAEDATRAPLTLLAMLSLAMGSLNATVAAATGGRIRTTHLSGPATDLATSLTRSFLRRGNERDAERRWTFLRVAIVVAFAFGALLAATLAPLFEFRLFLVPATAILLGAGLAAPSLEPATPARAPVFRNVQLD